MIAMGGAGVGGVVAATSILLLLFGRGRHGQQRQNSAVFCLSVTDFTTALAMSFSLWKDFNGRWIL